MEAVLEVGDHPGTHAPRPLNYGQDLEAAVGEVDREVRRHSPALVERYPARWLALKLLEADPLVAAGTGLGAGSFISRATKHLKLAHGEDIESLLGDARYAQASGLTRKVLKKKATTKRESDREDRPDRAPSLPGHPHFSGGHVADVQTYLRHRQPVCGLGRRRVQRTHDPLNQALFTLIAAPSWLGALATEGVIGGVGMVLTFVPIIFAMMFFITLLEASGYMARAAFVMDRAMHAMGLHGKSFIPMLLGFGCNVPAIYATRTLENPKDKILTALLIPLMSCGAKLPVYALFTGLFFLGQRRYGDLVALCTGYCPGHDDGDYLQENHFPGGKSLIHHGTASLSASYPEKPDDSYLGEGETLSHQGRHLYSGHLRTHVVSPQSPLGGAR